MSMPAGWKPAIPGRRRFREIRARNPSFVRNQDHLFEHFGFAGGASSAPVSRDAPAGAHGLPFEPLALDPALRCRRFGARATAAPEREVHPFRTDRAACRRRPARAILRPWTKPDARAPRRDPPTSTRQARRRSRRPRTSASASSAGPPSPPGRSRESPGGRVRRATSCTSSSRRSGWESWSSRATASSSCGAQWSPRRAGGAFLPAISSTENRRSRPRSARPARRPGSRCGSRVSSTPSTTRPGRGHRSSCCIARSA